VNFDTPRYHLSYFERKTLAERGDSCAPRRCTARSSRSAPCRKPATVQRRRSEFPTSHQEASQAPAGARGASRIRQDLHRPFARNQPRREVAYVDTEAGSASKYAHLFAFDVNEMQPPFHPRRAAEAINEAVAGGYDVVIVDSLSHFWQGKGGLLELVDEIARTKYRGDSHRAWNDGGEIERELIDAILRSPIHVIGAMRTKRDYVRVEENGKTKIRAAGTKTIQREEFDFEFDLVGRFDVPSVLTVTKTRVDTLPPETVIDKPGAEMAALLKTWLSDGVEVKQPSATQRKRIEKLAADCAEAAGKDKDEILARIGPLNTAEDADAVIAKLDAWKDTLTAETNGKTTNAEAVVA
jgi:hypothetical protein